MVLGGWMTKSSRPGPQIRLVDDIAVDVFIGNHGARYYLPENRIPDFEKFLSEFRSDPSLQYKGFPVTDAPGPPEPTVGERIKSRRQFLNLTQTALAERLQTTQ